jgi:hypothetical protein
MTRETSTEITLQFADRILVLGIESATAVRSFLSSKFSRTLYAVEHWLIPASILLPAFEMFIRRYRFNKTFVCLQQCGVRRW